MLTEPQNDLLYLMKCGVLNQIPSIEKVNQMEMEEVYSLAKKHSIAAFIAWVLNNMKADYPLKDKWIGSLDQAVRHRIIMDNFAKDIFQFLETSHCWYMPLKGYVLKDYYPGIGTRQMGDIDILFDPAYRKKVHDYFLENGFQTDHYNKSNHDVYKKEQYEFEMHVSLFLNARNPDFDNYFDDIFPLLERVGNTYEYKMPPNFFYVYLVAHAAKHYELGGTGIRQLIDFYYVLHNYDLDFKNINKMLEEIGLTEYEKTLRNLVIHFFNDDKCSDEEQFMLEYMVDSETHGTLFHKVENQLEDAGNSRFMYWIHRAFPGRNWFEIRHPFIAKYPILIPFFWIYRFYLALFPRRWKLKAEREAINTIKNEENKTV